ncbi:MAG: HEAT repeat domain-containing protein [Gammaproteobacteria bacterium]|nr:HEAT repeat domain-containing protein [Gammaproteobacteria bacterium]
MTKGQKNITSSQELPDRDAPPKVLMLIGVQCTFCGPMMQALTELMKSGHMAELKIVNIEDNMELAERLGVRSVPWLQIGPFELQGSRTKQELLLWLKRAASSAGLTEYLEEVLSEGDIQLANKLIRHHPHAMENVLGLMADPEAKINVRLGVGVIIEEMVESDMFKKVIPQLIEYLSNHDARIRGDACHYLSLTKDQAYVPAIEKLLSDESEEVREIAQDSLEDLRAVNE